jgi:hypothetical protein
MVEIAPPRATLELFERLRALGNTGPLAEIPLHLAHLGRISTSVLLSAYHHRRTVACLGSYLPPSSERVQDLLARLPSREAVDELRDLGVTTLVVHHAPGNPLQEQLRRRFEAAAARPYAPIVRLDGNEEATAWEIRRPRRARGSGREPRLR